MLYKREHNVGWLISGNQNGFLSGTLLIVKERATFWSFWNVWQVKFVVNVAFKQMRPNTVESFLQCRKYELHTTLSLNLASISMPLWHGKVKLVYCRINRASACWKCTHSSSLLSYHFGRRHWRRLRCLSPKRLQHWLKFLTNRSVWNLLFWKHSCEFGNKIEELFRKGDGTLR